MTSIIVGPCDAHQFLIRRLDNVSFLPRHAARGGILVIMAAGSVLLSIPIFTGDFSSTATYTFSEDVPLTGFSVTISDVNGQVVYLPGGIKVLMTATVSATGYGAKPEDVFLNQTNTPDGHVSFRPVYPVSVLSAFRHYTVSLSVSYPSTGSLQNLIIKNAGSVRAQLSNMTANGSYIVTTMNGNIEIALPSGGQFHLTAKSTNNGVGIEDFLQCGPHFTRDGATNILTATCGNGAADVELYSQTGGITVDTDYLPTL